MRRFLFVAALALLAAAPVEAQKRGDRSTLTRQDIDEAGNAITNAEDAVRRLRPFWLRGPSGRFSPPGVDGAMATTATDIVLYIDDRRQPGLDQMRTVRNAEIEELKWMDANRAIQMLGPGHELGVIIIKTRKPQ